MANQAQRPTRARLIYRLGFALGLLLLGPGLQADDPQDTEGYSRSAWIERNRLRGVEFSGGLIPKGDWRPRDADRVLAPQARVDAKKTKRPRRVNGDLLDMENHPQPGTQAEPYLHVNPTNAKHLIAGWQENRFEDGGAQALHVAVSFNGGRAWTESTLPGLTLVSGGPWDRASDPWVEFGPDGDVYFASLLINESNPDNAIGVSRSTDGGRTWEDPVEVFSSNVDFNDKEALTVDVFPDSRFLGRIYVAWDINVADATGQNVVSQDLVVARSQNSGESYRNPRLVRSGPTNIGAIPRVGPDGTVYVVWAGSRGGDPTLFVYFSSSRNGGRGWSSPRIIAILGTVGVPDIRSGGILPSFAIDPNTGDQYVVWQDSRWSGVDQITMIFSRNNGQTWSDPELVSAAPLDAATFTTSVAVNELSQVAVSYYSLENDPARAFLVDRFLRISDDGGRTFGPAIRATRRTFDIRFAAQARGYFLGDYVGLAGANKQFHLLWVDTRRTSPTVGSKQPDVWTARSR